jgi:hypothetical protein
MLVRSPNRLRSGTMPSLGGQRWIYKEWASWHEPPRALRKILSFGIRRGLGRQVAQRRNSHPVIFLHQEGGSPYLRATSPNRTLESVWPFGRRCWRLWLPQSGYQQVHGPRSCGVSAITSQYPIAIAALHDSNWDSKKAAHSTPPVGRTRPTQPSFIFSACFLNSSANSVSADWT